MSIKKKPLTEEEIRKALQVGTRWGCNSQPSLNEMVRVLSNPFSLSVKIIGLSLGSEAAGESNGDTLYIEVSHEPIFCDGVFFAALDADEVTYEPETKLIRLWWD